MRRVAIVLCLTLFVLVANPAKATPTTVIDNFAFESFAVCCPTYAGQSFVVPAGFLDCPFCHVIYLFLLLLQEWAGCVRSSRQRIHSCHIVANESPVNSKITEDAKRLAMEMLAMEVTDAHHRIAEAFFPVARCRRTRTREIRG